MDTIKINSGKAKMIAHRGVSGIERENTNAAFVAAGNRSYFGVETDVHVTKDGKFVIIHDDTTDRVSLGEYTVNVEKCDFEDLESIVLPDLDGSRVRRDIKISSLREYIHICKKYGKICVLELKNHFEEADLKRMIDEIRGTGYVENIIFISFDLANCINVRNLLPDNEVQWLIGDDVPENLADILCENKLDLDIYYKVLTKEKIDAFHARGIKINCWTCDNKEEGEKLAEYGVEFITSNILE